MEGVSFDLALINIDGRVTSRIEVIKLHRFASSRHKPLPTVGLTAKATPEAIEQCARGIG